MSMGDSLHPNFPQFRQGRRIFQQVSIDNIHVGFIIESGKDSACFSEYLLRRVNPTCRGDTARFPMQEP